MKEPLAIFDAHLDLAMNVAMGRDVLRPAAEQPPSKSDGIATVGLPDLRAGGVTGLCATLFCMPKLGGNDGYATADEAYAMAQTQLATYAAWRAAGETDIPGSPATLVLIEGGDCVRTPDDLPVYHAAGVRALGMAWQGTRYAGGTGTPGPLTADGRGLVRHLDALGIVHDATHLAERSFWDLLEATDRTVVATHSNCRAIVGADPRERHFSDAMIRAVAERDGVIGVCLCDRFLLPVADHGKRRATLADVVAHVRHVCDVAGDADHVGIGSDMDGGFGREEIPVEIVTSADLPKIYDALLHAGFTDVEARKVMGGNWRRIFGPVMGTG